MAGGGIERILGGSPLGVLFKLALLSLLVGFILASLGVTPGDILVWVQSRLAWLWRRGWSLVTDAGSWILVGSLIVVPLWLLSRLFSRRR